MSLWNWLFDPIRSFERRFYPPPYIWTLPGHCPSCDSPAPELHPDFQFDGQVYDFCPDPFHQKEPNR